jgi:hypothetical protein
MARPGGSPWGDAKSALERAGRCLSGPNFFSPRRRSPTVRGIAMNRGQLQVPLRRQKTVALAPAPSGERAGVRGPSSAEPPPHLPFGHHLPVGRRGEGDRAPPLPRTKPKGTPLRETGVLSTAKARSPGIVQCVGREDHGFSNALIRSAAVLAAGVIGKSLTTRR